MPTLASGKKNDGNPPQSSNSQAQSRLFSLPTELRSKIFTLALACPLIQLTYIDELSGAQKLKLVTPGVGGPDIDTIRAQRLLSLPLTCRQAQAEALPILYGSNTFGFGGSEPVLLFAQRKAAAWIRRLSFSWMRSKPPEAAGSRHSSKKKLFGGLFGGGEKKRRMKSEDWNETWQAIASFRGLQWIRVEIYVPDTWTPEWKQREEELMTPLKQIVLKPEADAVLTLTWEREKGDSTGKSAEDLLPAGWTVERKPWGAGSEEFPTSAPA